MNQFDKAWYAEHLNIRRNILLSICLFQTVQDVVRSLRHGEKTLAKTEDADEAAGWGFLSRVILRSWCILLIKQKLCLTGKMKCFKILQCLTFKSKIIAWFLFWVGSWFHIFLCSVLQVWNSCKRRGEKNTLYIIYVFVNCYICIYLSWPHLHVFPFPKPVVYDYILPCSEVCSVSMPQSDFDPFSHYQEIKGIFPFCYEIPLCCLLSASPSCFMSFSVISLPGQ